MRRDLRWRRRAAPFACACLLAAPLLLVVLARRLLARGAPTALRERVTGAGARPPPGGVLVHGVSMGEVMLMRALVPRLESATGLRCVPSTATATGHAALAKQFPDRVRCALPLDLPWAVACFLRRVRPRALILLESEIWPLLLCGCFERGIPVFIVNARIGADSFRGYRRAGPWLGPLFRQIDTACAQNPTWAARLRRLGVARCRVTGSLKADMVVPADAAQREAEAQRIALVPGAAEDKRVLLLASTGPDEELPLIRSWQRWGREHGWRLVVCPRHPERGPAIVATCAQLDLRAVRSSQAAELTQAQTYDVIVVDEIGRLSALYANAAIAVVGGGLGSGRGGQNMLEAAAAGCCTVVGPDWRNQPDAMAVLQAADA
ncbi:MAG: 3-deoxy-D-manno-octulosonic acid transferase, partial [Planctomycetota bacterium]